MSKEKLLSIALLIVSFVFSIYFGYNNYQEKKRLKTANAELTNQINQLEQTYLETTKSSQITKYQNVNLKINH
ncbi:hypothetical protein J3U16_06855 [Gilliamella sp. B3023]|uniref:hypothetical protein n=1 Tax=unclassified Gilliamella TaxID=2685620 RepID=UPI00226AF0BD|nr:MULTISPECIES: hypothetical protein [unclassified Gilliamella]MCX8585136.1 hypothetical protein [Gilliamella sp. B3562]MCX8675009.1 hypothetical protein [Gilliamella sp. B3023]MCX8685198.1 hypothetical protein [Gilliamella sp. B2864]